MTQQNFDTLIATSANASAVAEGLRRLEEANLLTQHNFDLLFDRSSTLEPILLTEQNFQRLFRPNIEPRLLESAGLIIPSGRLPARRLPESLTQESFEEFVMSFLSAKYHPSSPMVASVLDKWRNRE